MDYVIDVLNSEKRIIQKVISNCEYLRDKPHMAKRLEIEESKIKEIDDAILKLSPEQK